MVKGKKNKITVFADAACNLCEIKSFDKSEILEKWWQDVHDEWLRNNYHITVICPHPQLVLMNKLDSKYRIMDSHDMLVDLNNYDLHSLIDTHAKEHGLNILIVESDPDLMTLYTELFTKRNINAVVTSESNECLLAIKEKDYDIIILDMHLTGNLKATDLAKEIYQIRPAQRIVLTTTNPLYRTSIGITSFKVTSEDVLVKPFRLSNLIDVIENKRYS
jgi:CheY-like chemotaxis protein